MNLSPPSPLGFLPWKWYRIIFNLINYSYTDIKILAIFSGIQLSDFICQITDRPTIAQLA